MNISNEKYQKLSKFFLFAEVLFNLSYITIVILLTLLTLNSDNSQLYTILPLLIFLLFNSSVKILCFIKTLSIRKRIFFHIPLVVYLIILVILNFINTNTIIFIIFFFTILFTLNLKYNYFIKIK